MTEWSLPFALGPQIRVSIEGRANANRAQSLHEIVTLAAVDFTLHDYDDSHSGQRWAVRTELDVDCYWEDSLDRHQRPVWSLAVKLFYPPKGCCANDAEWSATVR